MPLGGSCSSRTALPKGSPRGNFNPLGEACSSGIDLTKESSRGKAVPLGGTSPTDPELFEGSTREDDASPLVLALASSGSAIRVNEGARWSL